MKVDTALRIARAELVKHGLNDWTIELRRFKTTGGMTYFDDRVIAFGPALIELWTPKQFKEILKHEVAHALAGFSAAHGDKWKQIARAIGCSAEVTHDYPTVPGRWILFCGNCGELATKHRPVATTHMHCLQCDAPITLIDSKESESGVA